MAERKRFHLKEIDMYLLLWLKERDMYLMESTTSYVECRFAGQLISIIHRSNPLGSSHGGKIQCSCVVLPPLSIPRHRPTQKEIQSAPPRPDLYTYTNNKQLI